MVQQYSNYTGADHYVWSILYSRQLEKIKEVAYAKFEKGIRQLHFESKRIPDFTKINPTLRGITGWQIYPVPGLMPNADFFSKMFAKQFGATTWIRKMEELDYLEEPDMFHDVFGHIPLLTDPRICDFLHGLARIAVIHIDDQDVIEALARLYWYTIEFGLVKENNQLKIYGAGILSSIGETDYCLSDRVARIPFDLEKILDTPYIKDEYQEQYFVLECMDQLAEALLILESKFNPVKLIA